MAKNSSFIALIALFLMSLCQTKDACDKKIETEGSELQVKHCLDNVYRQSIQWCPHTLHSHITH
jgi:hypothetical protein